MMILLKNGRDPMKNLRIYVLVCLIALFTTMGFSQVRVRGSVQSSLYGWENLQENQQWDFYQGLNLRITPENYSRLYVNTFLREAYRGDPAEWQERIYNLYAHWNAGKNLRLRIGRQFLYRGVINGTMDAALLQGQISKKLQVQFVAGLEAPVDRTFSLRKWDEGNVLGGYLSYHFLGRNRAEVSYFQKSRNEKTVWQQIGATFSGSAGHNIDYYARTDFNLLASDYQTLRGRLTYYQKRWTASVEVNSQKPRIYEDSFYNIFEIKAFNQLRTAATYRVGNYNLSLQYLFTLYEEDSDNRIMASASSSFGTLGLIYQTGFGGDNIGYFGEIHYEIFPHLTARLFNSIYNYEQAYTNISENATSFSAGLSYKFRNVLNIRAELQNMSNSYYKSDFRGLLRFTYIFSY